MNETSKDASIFAIPVDVYDVTNIKCLLLSTLLPLQLVASETQNVFGH